MQQLHGTIWTKNKPRKRGSNNWEQKSNSDHKF